MSDNDVIKAGIIIYTYIYSLTSYLQLQLCADAVNGSTQFRPWESTAVRKVWAPYFNGRIVRCDLNGVSFNTVRNPKVSVLYGTVYVKFSSYNTNGFFF